MEAVDALSLDEALLLARELPHLGTLIRGELPGVDRDVSRRLALGVLNVAQGHPKLLELADGQAADPGRLAALVEAGDQAWREPGGLPDGFFSHRGDPGAPARITCTCSARGPGRLAEGCRPVSGRCSGSCAAWRSPTGNGASSTATGPACGPGSNWTASRPA